MAPPSIVVALVGHECHQADQLEAITAARLEPFCQRLALFLRGLFADGGSELLTCTSGRVEIFLIGMLPRSSWGWSNTKWISLAPASAVCWQYSFAVRVRCSALGAARSCPRPGSRALLWPLSLARERGGVACSSLSRRRSAVTSVVAKMTHSSTSIGSVCNPPQLPAHGDRWNKPSWAHQSKKQTA